MLSDRSSNCAFWMDSCRFSGCYG